MDARRLLLSRRKAIYALGASAIAGLSACREELSGVSGTAPPSSAPAARISGGYSDQQSYRPGDRVALFLNGDSPGMTVRLSNYNGQRVHEVAADLFPQQPAGAEPWETGFGYSESAAFTLPLRRSGVYLVEGIVPLIVKHAYPSGAPTQAEIVIVYPTNTVAAYNAAGGRSMYSKPTPAPIVSFRRPNVGGQGTMYFGAFLEWFANVRLPYSVGYVADIDLEDYSEIAGAKLLIVIGHSEYWTRRARENFDQFVEHGGNALFLSGNNMWWQVRYSDDRSQLICYKDLPDPVGDPLLETINWTNPALDYPTLLSVGADFAHGGYGIALPEHDGFHVLLPQSPVFRGLSVKAGDVLAMRTKEYDGAPLLNNPPTLGQPQLDLEAMGAYRAEIIAYQACSRNDNDVANNVATWIAYQRTATSGVVMNGASTNWCSLTGVSGPDRIRVRKIILNMIDILVTEQPVFAS